MSTNLVTEYVNVPLVIGCRHDDIAEPGVLVIIGVMRDTARTAHNEHVLNLTECTCKTA